MTRHDEAVADYDEGVVEKGSRRANPLDLHVGSRVRLQHMLLGMSQEKLGEQLGLTFQQIQKYEKGINRIGASRLFDLAKVLGVNVQFFYDEAPGALTEGRTMSSASGLLREARGSTSLISSVAAKASSSTRRSCASLMPRCAARSSIWCVRSPVTTGGVNGPNEGAHAAVRRGRPIWHKQCKSRALTRL